MLTTLEHRRRYGARHKQLRRMWAKRVALGTNCVRCGRGIVPAELCDLDHDDSDPTAYVGVSHRYCNRAAGARKGNRKRRRHRHSREWT
jgi:hypothetical protein